MSDYDLPPSNPVVYDRPDIRALFSIVMAKRRRHLFLVAAMAIAIVVATIIVYPRGDVGYDSLPYALILAIAAGVLGSIRFNTEVWFRSAQRNGTMRPQRFAITEQEFRINEERGAVQLRWEHVVRVVREDERLFVFSTKNCAYIVPRRAFDASQAFEHFCSAAQDKFAAHKLVDASNAGKSSR